jgi:hypothetical protein
VGQAAAGADAGPAAEAESGEAAVPPGDIERLRNTERDLSAALGSDEE